jgi:hypothetical protein
MKDLVSTTGDCGGPEYQDDGPHGSCWKGCGILFADSFGKRALCRALCVAGAIADIFHTPGK